MKKIILFVAMLCFIACGVFADGTNLELKFEKDTQNIYDMKSNITITDVNLGGYYLPMSIPPIKTEGQIFEKVLDVDKDKNAIIKTTFEMIVDGKKETSYVINVVTKYGQIIETLEIFNNGQTQKHTEENPLAIRNITNLISQKFLPEKSIALEDSWEIDNPMSEKNPVGIKLKNTLSKLEDKDGEQIATIQGNYNLKINISDFANNMGSFFPQDQNMPASMISSLEGDAVINFSKNEQLFSVTKGLIISNIMEGDINVNVTEPDTAMPITASMSVNITTTFKETEKLKEELSPYSFKD